MQNEIRCGRLKSLYERWCYYRSDSQIEAPEIRFLFFAHSRSGSHLFADLLGSHPDITCTTEHDLLLRRKGVRDPFRYIDGISKRFDTKVFGGKVSIRQLDRQDDTSEKVLSKLANDGWQFILLERQNLLEQAISVQIAKNRKRYHDTTLPSIEQMQIEIDLTMLHNKMQKKLKINQRTREVLRPYDPLEVNYEEGLIGPDAQQHTANQVFDFLGVQTYPVKTSYVKTGVYKLSDYITNYDEMVDSLSDTQFAKFSLET